MVFGPDWGSAILYSIALSVGGQCSGKAQELLMLDKVSRRSIKTIEYLDCYETRLSLVARSPPTTQLGIGHWHFIKQIVPWPALV